MNCCEPKLFSEIILPIATCLAFFLGGAWAFIIFFRQRENEPRIDFKADIELHKKIGDYWIVELVAYVENKGKIQHKIYNLDFDFSCLAESDKVELNPSHNNQVFFPCDLVSKGDFMNKKLYEFFRIEPGVKEKYSHITRVPAEAAAVIFHVRFEYKTNYLNRLFNRLLKRKAFKEIHVAEATKALPKTDG